VSDLPLSSSQLTSLSSYFLSPVQLRRGSDKVVLVDTWHLSRPNPNSRSLQELLLRLMAAWGKSTEVSV